jgi:hypothetical protein
MIATMTAITTSIDSEQSNFKPVIPASMLPHARPAPGICMVPGLSFMALFQHKSGEPSEWSFRINEQEKKCSAFFYGACFW